MTALELLDNIRTRSDEKSIFFINQFNYEIQLLFLKIENSTSELETIEQLFLNLNNRHAAAFRESFEFQSIVTHIALYFKRINDFGNVRACELILRESSIKKRLSAYIFQMSHPKWSGHVDQFNNYIKILSSSLEDEFEDYINDVLSDLYNYKNITIKKLVNHNETAIAKTFSSKFEDLQLAEQFPLLKYYHLNYGEISTAVKVQPYTNKIYQPSLFSDHLFNEKFITYIRTHKNTRWHEILLGYDKFTIRNNILKYGQAIFDNGYENLSKQDVVKLYCFMNMRKHFFTSYSVLERTSIIKKYYRSDSRIRFIDIGCGPATSGVALVDYLHDITKTKVLFDYFGIDINKSMLSEAQNIMNNHVYDSDSHMEFLTDLDSIDTDKLNGSSCLIFNACYLFASPTLNINHLSAKLNKIRKSQPYTPAYFIYQNTTDPVKNEKYQQFKTHFAFTAIEYRENLVIYYNNKRNSLYEPADETVFFEILKL